MGLWTCEERERGRSMRKKNAYISIFLVKKSNISLFLKHPGSAGQPGEGYVRPSGTTQKKSRPKLSTSLLQFHTRLLPARQQNLILFRLPRNRITFNNLFVKLNSGSFKQKTRGRATPTFVTIFITRNFAYTLESNWTFLGPP